MNTVCGILSTIQLSLLAQGGRFEDLGGRFRRGGSDNSGQMVVMLVVVGIIIAVAIVLAKLFNGRSERQSYNSPRRLFRELCKAHKLNRTQKRLLRQLSKWHRLDTPSRLFLESNRFELDVSAKFDAEMLATLRMRLFG